MQTGNTAYDAPLLVITEYPKTTYDGHTFKVSIPSWQMNVQISSLALIDSHLPPEHLVLETMREKAQQYLSAIFDKAKKSIKGNELMPITFTKKSQFEQHVETVAAKPVLAQIEITKKKASENAPYVAASNEEKIMDSAVIPTHKLAQVYVSGSTTINLGNYESAKITIGLTMPTDKEDIADAYEFASDWVSERIAKAVKEAKGDA